MTNKEAIEKLKEISFMTGYKEALDLAIKALEERPQGEWIKSDIETIGSGYFWKYRCSICNKEGGEANFCSNCGADMRGDNDDRQSIQS